MPLGAYNPPAISRAQNYSNTKAFTVLPCRYPLNPGSRECTCGQSTFARNTTWLSGSVCGLQARDRGFDPRLDWIMLRRCAPRQGTWCTRALSQSRSKWVPGRTVKACVFQQYCSPGMAAVPYALPLEVEMAFWMNRSCYQGVIVWSRVSSASR